MYNEAEWIKLIFVLADIQTWLNDLSRETFNQLPVAEKKKLFRKSYYLTASAFSHILERHYHKINRHPQASKFTISAIEILNYIRDAYAAPATPMEGCNNFQRTVETPSPVGYDRNGNSTSTITIVTDGGGKIVTAFPGKTGKYECINTISE